MRFSSVSNKLLQFKMPLRDDSHNFVAAVLKFKKKHLYMSFKFLPVSVETLVRVLRF